ncbi:hypothetical protein ABPG72_022547 [Tetrahymena utriculariae]
MSVEVIKLQQELENEVKDMQNLQKELQKLNEGRQKLIEQQNESELVQKEIDLLEEEAVIYKLSGPILIRQTLTETKNTIKTRIEYIRKEAIKGELLLKDNETKQLEKKNKIVKLQENYYKAVMGPQYAQMMAAQQAQAAQQQPQ